jgi:myo-inositol-1-phosphate synthase
MMGRRIGLWLVGAYGGVGTALTLGLAALARGLSDQTGLVTALPEFAGLPLAQPEEFVVGGHEIRQTDFATSAEEFRQASGVFDTGWIAACRDELAVASARVRPGPWLGLSRAVSRLASWAEPRPTCTVRQAADVIAEDLDSFCQAELIDHLIILNLGSTEPPFTLSEVHNRWETLALRLADSGHELLPSSSIYALAAIEGGHTYINFTPSLGASLPALRELAARTGALYAGKDGKTGETLLKTVLAPMFAHRNLRVQSWVGHNIVGNRDGQVLDDPSNKSSKVDTKDQVLVEIFGYKPSSVITIEYVSDMGDWKTAWDHIHFQGFLGAKMTLQFTWQGCDSLLAAPLCIDLARLADLEKQRGARGPLHHLACFFKSPEGVTENDFFKQYERLIEYVGSIGASTDSTDTSMKRALAPRIS